MILTPLSIRAQKSRAHSNLVLPRPEAGSPGSLYGVFQHKNSFRPDGDPSKSMSRTLSTPNIVVKCSFGLATVAEHEMNLTRLFPTAAHIRRSLRMMNETCDPIWPL